MQEQTALPRFSVPQEELDKQAQYAAMVESVLLSRFPVRRPRAFVHTYGCQGNVADGEKIKGILESVGYDLTEEIDESDLVLYNTCAIREHAQDRVFGNVGKRKAWKEADRSRILALCGCMMQQEYVAEKIKKSYPYVDLVFGTHVIHKLPEFLYRCLCSGKRVFDLSGGEGNIVEGLPVHRDGTFKAWVPIMYGCNNFCTYCIVPYTRGRERSRRPEDILAEVRELAENGTKEIMLLGQNVNSYGKIKAGNIGYCYKDEADGLDFAGLLAEVDKVEGIERIRFMTSHPKDLSDDLIECFDGRLAHLCRQIHLPVQSGSDRILKKMNRVYDRERYLERVAKLREVCPEIAITTDIIVGFPGETEEDFEDTIDLVKRVRYDSAFTFLYSIRKGTPAAEYPDQVPEAVKHERFDRLIEVIHGIQEEKSVWYQDRVLPVLVEGPSRTNKRMLTGRTESGRVVDFPGDPSLIGRIIDVRITKAQTFSNYGEPVV